jgi:hypothetical protein
MGQLLGLGNVPPESESFSDRPLTIMFIAAFVILYSWSLRLLRDVWSGKGKRLVMAIPLAILALIVNIVLAVAGCGVIRLV